MTKFLSVVGVILVITSSVVRPVKSIEISDKPELGYIIGISGLSNLGRASSIAVDTTTGHLYIGIDNTGFAELSPDGQLLNTFTISGPIVDNSGFDYNPLTGNLLFVNGLNATNPEPIIEISITGTLISEISSPIIEGTGLAIDPQTNNLFILDIVSTSSHLVRELNLDENNYTEVNSFALPTILGDASDAGLDFNPSTGNLSVTGESGQNPGIVFEVDRDGNNVQEYIDTGLSNGISGIAFDNEPFRLYVLAGYDKQIYVYGSFEKIYLPIVTNN
ncbi:MAG: hypothetical protein R3C14_25765 [Caldilineaceae bacterium]